MSANSPRRMTRRVLHGLVFGLLAGAMLPATGSALAQGTYPGAAAGSYPQRPIRLVVPYPAGGSADILARTLGEKLSPALGQQIVVDNKAGAGGNIGTDAVAKAPADGYTLALGLNTTHATNISLYKDMTFDPVKDFAPISLVAAVTHVLVVHPSVAAKTAAELVALAKAQPGKLNYASTGNGSAAHLTGELFKQAAGVDIQHIPYKGGAPMMTDLLAGQVQASFATLPTVLTALRQGQLRALATTGRSRAPQLADVPTMIEQGFRDFESDAWFGILAPAGTPATVIDRLNREIAAAVKDADLSAKLVQQGFEPRTTTSAAFASYIAAETAKWAKVIKESGAKLD